MLAWIYTFPCLQLPSPRCREAQIIDGLQRVVVYASQFNQGNGTKTALSGSIARMKLSSRREIRELSQLAACKELSTKNHLSSKGMRFVFCRLQNLYSCHPVNWDCPFAAMHRRSPSNTSFFHSDNIVGITNQ